MQLCRWRWPCALDRSQGVRLVGLWCAFPKARNSVAESHGLIEAGELNSLESVWQSANSVAESHGLIEASHSLIKAVRFW